MSHSFTTAILNGHLIDPANRIDQPLDLFIADGKVCGVGETPKGFHADQTIDATGRIVCPGLIDLNVHLREPGQEYKATIASETAAAAKGGITTLCCTPNTNPVIDTPAVVTLIQRSSQQTEKARVLPIGALTQQLQGEQLSEMAALKRAGCPALSNVYSPLANTLVERRALEYAATFDIPVIIRPEDRHLRDGGCVHEGAMAARLGLPGTPEAAETVAIARDLALAAHTGCRVHFHALSTATAVRMIHNVKQQQHNISADVAVHQLHLTEMDLEGFDSNHHVNPPLRTLNDREMLRRGVAEGTIAAICSDHQPHEADAKEAPFPSTAPGISGLETLLPLTLKLVQEEVLELSEAIKRLTAGPADILDLPLGCLGIGSSADICVFDPRQRWTLRAEEMLSNGRNTPFIGHEFTGRVTHTLLEGCLVYEYV